MVEIQNSSWLHEILTGAVLANIGILGSILKYGFRFYDQHTKLWAEYEVRMDLQKRRLKGKVRINEFD